MSGNQNTRCFHCDESLAGSTLLARLEHGEKPVCCIGCRAVAEMIASSGLDDFYERRTAASPKPTSAVSADEAWQAYLRPEVAAEFVRHTATTESVDLLIENLRCSACGWLIERTLGIVDGVMSVEVNAALGRAHIEWLKDDTGLERIMRTIAQLGYVPHPITAETTMRVYRSEKNTMLKRFIVATFGMMQVMMFAVAGYSAELNHEVIDPTLEHYFRLISLLVSLPVIFYAARPFLSNAWNNLRTRTVGMDLPVSAALLLAFVASMWNTLVDDGEVYFDSITMFVFFLTLSRFIELSVRHRTNSVADALARHLPATAQRVAGNGIDTVAIAQLRRSDQVIVPSGATIPADGVLMDAIATLNESLLTGESMPVMRKHGESIAAGSINSGSPIRIEITATGTHTTLSTIVALVRRAQTQKPAAIQAADRAAALFLRVVLIASVCVCATWLIVDPSRAFSATLAVLVVACPCAFSIATPAAIAASTAQLARQGVLVTNPDALETLARIEHVIFDKTGTLTHGDVRLDACIPSPIHSESECLAIAASLERASEHPIAAAFKDVDTRGLIATSIKTVPGFGIEGVVKGRRYRIGVVGFVAELRGEMCERSADSSGGSRIVLGDEQTSLAEFVLVDTLRDDSIEAVSSLNRLGIQTEIVSGDSHAAVATIARSCKIPAFLARRSPAQKLARVQELQAGGKAVAMLGDGINDAPVLGAADVSIAMGRGAALAVAAADFIFVAERPSTLSPVIETARRTLTIARQNLVWSATYNFCALPLAALGLISPWVAAIGMSLSSLFVLLNALRLLPRMTELGTRRHDRSTIVSTAASAA
jgi:Cu2+-exporting ATPase